MGKHVNAEIGYQVKSAEELAKQMSALESRLLADLKGEFEAALGIPIPSASRAEILQLGTAMKYQTEVKQSEFLSCMAKLVQAVFTGRDAIVGTKALLVAGHALSDIFDGGPRVMLDFHGDSAKFENDGKVHVAAAYASTALCAQKDWNLSKDFYVSKYVFTVFQVSEPHCGTMLKVRSI